MPVTPAGSAGFTYTTILSKPIIMGTKMVITKTQNQTQENKMPKATYRLEFTEEVKVVTKGSHGSTRKVGTMEEERVSLDGVMIECEATSTGLFNYTHNREMPFLKGCRLLIEIPPALDGLEREIRVGDVLKVTVEVYPEQFKAKNETQSKP